MGHEAAGQLLDRPREQTEGRIESEMLLEQRVGSRDSQYFEWVQLLFLVSGEDPLQILWKKW